MSKVFKKRILPLVLVVAMLLSVVYISASAVMLGDLNNDGKVKANDARIILRVAAGLDTIADELKAAADVNGDGKIKANDARTVLRVAAEIETFATVAPTTEPTTEPTTGGGSVLPTTRPTRPSVVVTTRDNTPTQPTVPQPTTEAGNPYDDIVFLSKYYVKATVNEGGADSMVEMATDGKSMFVRTNMLSSASGNTDAGVLVKAENTSLFKLDKGVYLIDYKANKALFLSQAMIDTLSSFAGGEDLDITSFAGEMDEIKIPKFVSFKKMIVTQQVVGDETLNFVSLVNAEGIKTDYYFRGASQIPCIVKSYNKDGIVVSVMTIHAVSEDPSSYLGAPDMEIIKMSNLTEAMTFLQNMGLV